MSSASMPSYPETPGGSTPRHPAAVSPLGRVGRPQATGRPDDSATERAAAVPAPPPLDWVDEEVLAACRPAVRRLNESGLSSLAVTSVRRGEGRSTVTLGAALVNRMDYARPSVLLELDLARPSLGDRLGLPAGPGLAEVLRGESTLAEAIRWHDPQLGLLLAGVVEEPNQLLTAFLRSTVLDDLRRDGCVAFADLPPLPPEGRADRVAEDFDDLLLVVRSGMTPLSEVREAVRVLATPPDVVLNQVAPPVTRWLHRRKQR